MAGWFRRRTKQIEAGALAAELMRVLKEPSTVERIQAISELLKKRVAGIKENTDISYLAIVPILFEISASLSVQHLGATRTLDLLARALAAAEGQPGIPATALIGVEHPEQPSQHCKWVRITLWQLVQDINARSYEANEIAHVFGALGLQLAENVVDKWLAIALIKNEHEKLREVPRDIQSTTLSEAFLAALSESPESQYDRSPEAPMADADRKCADWELSTYNKVKDMSKNLDAFRLLAAACFALHQDMKRGIKVDVWKCDYLETLIDDLRSAPPRSVHFSDRLAKSIQLLSELQDANLTFCEQSSAQLDTEVLAATMRANAAGIWLLTIMSKTGSAKLGKLTMINMWLLLGAIPAADLVDLATIFTGTFFNGVACERLAPEDWPRVNDPNIFLASLAS